MLGNDVSGYRRRVLHWAFARVFPRRDNLRCLRSRETGFQESRKIRHRHDPGGCGPGGSQQRDQQRGIRSAFRLRAASGPALAILLGGLVSACEQRPMLFQQNPKFVWAVIASMYIGNAILLVLNLPLVGWWARIALIPLSDSRTPFIVLFSLIGAYSIRYLILDVWMALLFGGVGYLMRKFGFPLPRLFWRQCSPPCSNHRCSSHCSFPTGLS